jgi:tripartite-type tricarboxylate transporter receptor subunit TctC
MKFPRRRFLHLAAGAAALPAISRIAWAQTYPSRPVRLVVGFAPGGGTDVVARLMGQWLSERLGQPFIIENRSGAGSTIAAEVVVKAPPDGHTLLVATTGNAVSATLYDKLSFNFIRDIVPVGCIGREPNVMVVNPSVPAKTVLEFIAYANANPSKVNMGSGGNGGPSHMAGELFKLMAGVKLVHVPYRGNAPAVTALLGGQIEVLFASAPSLIAYVKSGQLRPLAVTTATRSELLPNVPAMANFVPGYEMSTWYGIGAPKDTPTEVIDKLNKEINAVLADSKLKARLTELGGMVLPGSPADFGKLIVDETEKWRKVIRTADIKAD